MNSFTRLLGLATSFSTVAVSSGFPTLYLELDDSIVIHTIWKLSVLGMTVGYLMFESELQRVGILRPWRWGWTIHSRLHFTASGLGFGIDFVWYFAALESLPILSPGLDVFSAIVTAMVTCATLLPGLDQ